MPESGQKQILLSKIQESARTAEAAKLTENIFRSETIASQDAVLIITDHTSVDYELIAKQC